ncbi:RNA polymerase I-specific transcription initiation factor RRN3 [Auricularia subglabra TFB-10046 SS5]|nr:RNA polymerase I-specific transcription initiation factor RRN3 [Auricularia subglabra TFB-10046 SS5]
MFVHARASPFNQRPVKQPLDMRQAFEYQHKQPQLPHDAAHKPPSSPSSPAPSSPASASKESILLLRPIATNSRIKQHKNLYLVFVNNALEQKARGNAEPYDELVGQFTMKSIEDGATTTHQLRQWLNALSHVVSQLGRSHAALVDAVVALPWFTMDEGLVKTYKNFIGMLVSARPEYLRTVLSRTVQCLTYQSGLRPRGDRDEIPLTRRAMFERLHSLLQSLLELIPTLPSTLQPLLVQHFPHKRQNRLSHLTYIRNILHITDYCPEVAEDIIATIIDRAIQIDVEIQVEMEELEAEGAGPDAGEIFTLDPFENVVGENEPRSDSDDDEGDIDDALSELSSEAEDLDNDPAKLEEERDLGHIQEMVTKLDAILKLVFEHFNRLQAEILSSSLPETDTLLDARRAQFLSLLTIFDTTILRTFKSRYTQFVVFWYASLDAEFADLFLGMLVGRALRDAGQPPVARAAAASYIASFVSRALFIGRAAARKVTELFCTFLAQHLALVEEDPLAARQHMVFYAAAQAVFLIFCFRWRDLLLEDEEGDGEVDDEMEIAMGASLSRKRRWLPELDVMQRVVSSPMNPLKVCSQNVVNQFARVAQHTDFLYCYPIMDGTATPRGEVGVGPAYLWKDGVQEEVHSFFPFDPYALPLSASFVQGIYREWSAVAIDDDDDDEDSDEDSDAEDAEEPQPSTPDVTAQLGASFGGMSISPERTRVLALGVKP